MADDGDYQFSPYEEKLYGAAPPPPLPPPPPPPPAAPASGHFDPIDQYLPAGVSGRINALGGAMTVPVRDLLTNVGATNLANAIQPTPEAKQAMTDYPYTALTGSALGTAALTAPLAAVPEIGVLKPAMTAYNRLNPLLRGTLTGATSGAVSNTLTGDPNQDIGTRALVGGALGAPLGFAGGAVNDWFGAGQTMPQSMSQQIQRLQNLKRGGVPWTQAQIATKIAASPNNPFGQPPSGWAQKLLSHWPAGIGVTEAADLAWRALQGRIDPTVLTDPLTVIPTMAAGTAAGVRAAGKAYQRSPAFINALMARQGQQGGNLAPWIFGQFGTPVASARGLGWQ